MNKPQNVPIAPFSVDIATVFTLFRGKPGKKMTCSARKIAQGPATAHSFYEYDWMIGCWLLVGIMFCAHPGITVAVPASTEWVLQQ